MPTSNKPFVAVLYNHVGEDVYEKLKEFDPKTLGFEPEYDIEVATVLDEYDAVVKGLRRAGFRARGYNLEEDIRRLERVLKRSKPDVVFNLVEHFRDDPELEAHIAALFDVYGVAYTGSTPFALALCQRKGLAKQLLEAGGVPTPRFHRLFESTISKDHGLQYPLIVKPAQEDASTGIDRDSVVHDHPQLTIQLERVDKEFGVPILVEEFIEGTELHVAILGNDPPEILPPIEWNFSDLPEDYPRIISYAAKWNPLAEVYHRIHSVCPADLTDDELEKVQDAAIRAYEITECRDYARVDIRLSDDGIPYVLEVNPNPDLTEGVSYMEAADEGGYTFAETLGVIASEALERRSSIKKTITPEPQLQPGLDPAYASSAPVEIAKPEEPA